MGFPAHRFKKGKIMICPLCEREVDQLTKHHLTPERRNRKNSDSISICLQCSHQIHALFDNRTLKTELNTLEKLKADPKVVKYVQWIQKRDGTFKIRESKQR